MTTETPLPHPQPTHRPSARGARTTRILTAALLVAAAILTNAAFTVLGSVFDYPDILKQPVDDVLAAFRADQATVTLWFTVMAAAAALFAPIAVGVGRLATGRVMRAAVPVGIAAAVVQTVGLLRWPVLVPGYAAAAAGPDATVAAAARHSFETAHQVLGTVVGETLGYLLTATWTVLVLVALHRRLAGRWFTVLGAVSAVLVAAGVLSPLGLPGVDTANFAGYILWSVWLLAFATLLVLRRDDAAVGVARSGARRSPVTADLSSTTPTPAATAAPTAAPTLLQRTAAARTIRAGRAS
jgi:hypothetical protein